MCSQLDPSCLSGMRVGIVEDETMIAMLIEDALLELGCTIVFHAASVEQALELAENERPDAVTLDGNLDGRLSSPVAERLNELGVPFMVVTGYVERTLTCPVLSKAPRLAKPFTSDSLVKAAAQSFC